MTCNIETSGLSETSCESAATMNLFPDLLAEEIPNIPNSSATKSVTKEPKAAQLTIFYCGQVIVFDDFPADKAMEIMSFASKISSDSTRPIPPNTPNTLIADLPIARKISLHRFLEKRKDRIAARSPYQISNPKEVSNKPTEIMPWLGLAARSPQC